MSTGPCAAASTFPDVESHWAKDYINSLHNLGYMGGYPDGTFKPDSFMTRAEFTSALIACMGVTHSDTSSANFSDTQGNWAAGAINEAVQLGILVPKEYPNGLVPGGSIKRSEACAMLIRALGKSPGSGLPAFKDQDQIKLSMYAGYIKTAADLGLMTGSSDGYFDPFNNMTRGEASVVLYKLLAQQGKVAATPATSSSPTTVGTTGSIRYVVIGDQSYDMNSVPVSLWVNYSLVPIQSISASASNIIVNGNYPISFNNSNNADIVVYNNRYGFANLTVSGDKLTVSTSYRKIYKFKVGDYSFSSDYVKLYINSANQGYYLSDMQIVDGNNVKIGGQEYDLSTDKITIATNSSETGNNFYDIKQISLGDQDTVMTLVATDPVVMNQLGISNIAAIFAGNTTLDLGSITNIYFIVGGNRYSLGEVTIDAGGNFSIGSNVYPYSQITMIVNQTQYVIDSIKLSSSKFIFYCDAGTNVEWVILNGQYRNASGVYIIKGTSIYTLDQALVVARNVVRINGTQYGLDSDLECQVDNKIYTIDDIYYDSSQQATIIDTGSLVTTSTAANQPAEFVFFNNSAQYQEGIVNTTIYVNGQWVSFGQVSIPDPSHFTYQNTSYALIGAQININNVAFKVTDTAWHGATLILDIYLQAQ
jgi:hypothetical protein